MDKFKDEIESKNKIISGQQETLESLNFQIQSLTELRDNKIPEISQRNIV